MAAIVDRLTVSAPSPPVPTTSTVSVPILSVGTRRAWANMVSASSLTSAGVGRLIFIATPNAAICVGVRAACHDLIHRPCRLAGHQRVLGIGQAAQDPGPGRLAAAA